MSLQKKVNSKTAKSNGCVIKKIIKSLGKDVWEYGKDHAEVNAIKNCKKKFGAKKALRLIAGSSVYVNLEPCSIEKNTPPCSDALIEHRIKKLFCGTLDPNPKINGRGIKLLKNAGIETSVGLLKGKCKELNRIFLPTKENLVPTLFLRALSHLMEKLPLKVRK